ncbi:carbonic anhydrase [Suillus occidentalis]|nr:carbonic anhydrase [Suillus occidentalis]
MPHESIQTLLNANEEWSQSIIKDSPTFFTQLAIGQSPKILWIGCSDSRVPESVITASKPGDIFVHRNIANQFHLNDDSALSVLTYAVKAVGVEHVVLVGHTNCGGAAACLQAAKDAAADKDASQPETPLTRWLGPLIGRIQSLDLSSVLPQLRHPNAKKVTVHGWVYDLARGRIDELVCREAKHDENSA